MAWPTLADVLGQPRAVASLRRAVASDRLHHAWVFHGPMGVGKMLTARAFAGLLLDPTTAPNLAGELEHDPLSEAQRLLAAGSHPDFTIVSKELAAVSRDDRTRVAKQRTIPKEVLLEFLIEPATRAGVRTTGARARRFFVVEEAHLIDAHISGVLLKMLEEPPPGVVIVLVTDQERDLPATIRSRCQRVAFGTLDEGAMAQWLKGAGLTLDPETKRWALGFARGSPGALLQAVECDMHAWSERLAPMLAEFERGRYAPEFAAEVKALASAESERRAAKAGPNASKEAANKAAADAVFALLHQWASARARAAAEGGARDEGDPRLTAAEAIAEAERRIDANANVEQAFDALAATLSRSR